MELTRALILEGIEHSAQLMCADQALRDRTQLCDTSSFMAGDSIREAPVRWLVNAASWMRRNKMPTGTSRVPMIMRLSGERLIW